MLSSVGVVKEVLQLDVVYVIVINQIIPKIPILCQMPSKVCIRLYYQLKKVISIL